jgi:hypothetical protein
MQYGAPSREGGSEAGSQVERAHGNRSRHVNSMACARRNPKRKVRRDQPDTLARGYVHNAADRVNQLIRPVRVFRDPKSGRVFVGQGRDGNAALRIVFCQNLRMSQQPYIMAQWQSCDKPKIGSS